MIPIMISSSTRENPLRRVVAFKATHLPPVKPIYYAQNRANSLFDNRKNVNRANIVVHGNFLRSSAADILIRRVMFVYCPRGGKGFPMLAQPLAP